MWKPEDRIAAGRRGLRYLSDMTNAEWKLVASLITPGRGGGRKRSVPQFAILFAERRTQAMA